MKNRKHYIVIPNPNKNEGYAFQWRKFIVIPEGEEYDEKRYYSAEETLEEAQEKADQRNSKYYISDWADDEIQEFYEQINFKVVEEAVSNYLGVTITFKHSIQKYTDGWYINLKSEQDLCEELPAIGLMLASCFVDNFSGGIFVDSETGELKASLSLHFSYSHFSLGSNGCSLAYCMYNKGEWRIRFERDSWLECHKRA